LTGSFDEKYRKFASREQRVTRLGGMGVKMLSMAQSNLGIATKLQELIQNSTKSLMDMSRYHPYKVLT